MNLKRALLLGLGSVAAYFAYQAFAELKKDVKRYDRISTMSGDKTLLEDQVDKLKDLVGAGSRNGSG